MRDDTTLPLFPESESEPGRRPGSPPPRFSPPRPAQRKRDLAIRRQLGEVVVRELPTRELLNRCDNARMPFVWTINPYRGCELACAYCYARPTHEYLGYPRREVFDAFEREIWAKVGGEAGLTKAKLEGAAADGAIAIGTATDPYQAAEARLQVTRRILGRIADAEGLEVSITTKSPLVARDVGLLAKIAERNRLTVRLSLSTVDEAIARALEPRAPSPIRRLETMRSLRAAGIDVALSLMPIVPVVADSEEAIRSVLEAAKEAGARSAAANPLFIPSAWRAEGWGWLIDRLPGSAAELRRLADDPHAFATWRDYSMARAMRLVHEAGLDPVREGDGPRRPSPQGALWDVGEPAARPPHRAARRKPFARLSRGSC